MAKQLTPFLMWRSLERLFTALSDGGAQLMPLGEYGFSRRFGWVNDRYGVSWQLNRS